MAELLLRCGCRIGFRENSAPTCPSHGNQAVVRVLGMPKPRIRGHATGPLVETVDLGPHTGRLVGSEPVETKES